MEVPMKTINRKNMAKIKPFEDFSEEYDEWFVRNKDKYEAELRALRWFIPAYGCGLEVGVGSGKFASPLGIKIAVEPSHKMADRARKLGIHVLPGLAEDLPVSKRKRCRRVAAETIKKGND